VPPKSFASDIQLNIPPDHEIDYGIIKSGLCDSPESQQNFDQHTAGHSVEFDQTA
jgi:hypothetical protein